MSHLTGRVLRVAREIPWPEWHTVALPAEIRPGAIVHEYRGYTYGCLSGGEIAVSLEPGVPPFFGIPRDAVEDWPGDNPHMAAVRDSARKAALRMIREADGEIGRCEIGA